VADGFGAQAPWVIETARLPVAFAQVREDSLLDEWVVDCLPGKAEVIMVASGGCTAAALASLGKVGRIRLIDPNPAQIALARLKLRLLLTATTEERLAILGHASIPFEARRARLRKEFEILKLPETVLSPLDFVARVGPDHAGRYEVLFSKLREALHGVENELEALLELSDPVEQARRVALATRLGEFLDRAFDSVMTQSNLVGLFGEAATRNRCEPFARHFARRTRHALTTMPAADNPYLGQLLRGRFPGKAVYPWLRAEPPSRMPVIESEVQSMAAALQGVAEVFDFIHLSNILDWLAPDEARATLELAWKALRPGGMVFIRQLNSYLEIQSLNTQFDWQEGVGKELHEHDRSFFYRRLHLGQKP
jgi:S-adenosylmethionine-diacylglycerol 3-amino-3-carboxypropyl transferase